MYALQCIKAKRLPEITYLPLCRPVHFSHALTHHIRSQGQSEKRVVHRRNSGHA